MSSPAPEDTSIDTSLFADPEDFYPPSPPPTTQTHTLPNTSQTLTVHLVGHSPLEAHRLWNGSRVISDFFGSSPSTTVAGRSVLEIGAGAGLPSIVAALLGASRVVVTDFPDPDLVANLWKNIDAAGLLPEEEDWEKGVIVADGFVWGADPARLLARLPEGQKGFDVLILADLLFRHSEHGKLADTISATLRKSRDSKAYVFFTSYRPWLQHKDLAFFDVVRDRGFVVDKIVERKMDRPLFENDPGDEDVLKTVTGWAVTWPADRWEE